MAVILPQSMQQDIQSSLPVIPNNGNPGGAYNVASAEPTPPAAPNDPYAWLQPSPYMDMINEIISNQDTLMEVALTSLFNPGIPASGYNVVGKEGSLKVQPVDEQGLVIPADSGGFYEWDLPADGANMPQYRPILPGE